jgi:hypothetical protein
MDEDLVAGDDRGGGVDVHQGLLAESVVLSFIVLPPYSAI